MDTRVTTKDSTIKEKIYRLSKMDARLASWIFVSLAGKADDSGNIISSLSKFTRDEFTEIQNNALSHVTMVEINDNQESLIPIMTSAGGLVKHLREDATTLLRLTTESIMFNISCFLEEKGSIDQT